MKNLRRLAGAATTIATSSYLATAALGCGGVVDGQRIAGAVSAAGHDAPRQVLVTAEAKTVVRRAPPDPVPKPETSAEVSLGGMLAYADQHSPVLAVARSTRARAEAERIRSAVLLPSNPELTVAAGPRITPAGTSVDLELGLMQTVPIGGQRGKRRMAADRLGELTDAEIDEMRWAVHCDVHAAFHGALVKQERVRLAERVVKFQTEVLRVVERQIAAGETAALTLRLARAEVAQAEQARVAAAQAFLASRLRLAKLSGWPVAVPPLPAGAVDHPEAPPSLEQLRGVAVARLPGLRVAAARVREAEAREEVAGSEAVPSPSIGVEYRREGEPRGEGATNVLLGLVSIPMPAFQRSQGDAARARADTLVAQAELSATRRLLDAELAEAHSEVMAAAARSQAYGGEIVPRFEENLSLLRRAFELGEIDILALSTGRERFLRIQSDALAAQEDYFVALAGLERIVGVDLWLDEHGERQHRGAP